VFFVVYSLVEKTKPILIVRRANSRLVNWRIRELVVDSRFRGNDNIISVLIGVNPRLYGRLFGKTKPICKRAE